MTEEGAAEPTTGIIGWAAYCIAMLMISFLCGAYFEWKRLHGYEPAPGEIVVGIGAGEFVACLEIDNKIAPMRIVGRSMGATVIKMPPGGCPSGAVLKLSGMTRDTSIESLALVVDFQKWDDRSCSAASEETPCIVEIKPEKRDY